MRITTRIPYMHSDTDGICDAYLCLAKAIAMLGGDDDSDGGDDGDDDDDDNGDDDSDDVDDAILMLVLSQQTRHVEVHK